MGKRDARVDAYIANSQPFAKPILKHLRTAVHAGCPDVEETMKWRMPHFTYKGMLCGMASFKAHCAFGFWKAAALKTGTGSRAMEGMGQFGRITSVADLPAEKQLIALVKKAARLNDEGVKVERVKHAPRATVPEPPADFLAALGRNKTAKRAYAALSPSHRREYVEWMTGAKRDATRQRRIATTIEWLAEGKALNWKYK